MLPVDNSKDDCVPINGLTYCVQSLDWARSVQQRYSFVVKVVVKIVVNAMANRRFFY